MGSRRVEKIIEDLQRKGFDMTTQEFVDTTVYKILRRHGIRDQLDLEEYLELLRRLMDFCAENDLKNMGMRYLDENDLKYK